MESRDVLQKSEKWCSLFASVAILTLAGLSASATVETELPSLSTSLDSESSGSGSESTTSSCAGQGLGAGAASPGLKHTPSVKNSATSAQTLPLTSVDDILPAQSVVSDSVLLSSEISIEPDTEDEVLIAEDVIEGDDLLKDGENEWKKTCKRADKTFIDQSLQRPLILVSSMDGQMTAFDSEDGSVKWNVNTGDLLSSSISKIEMSRKGIPSRLIPSLDGGLYQFDGKSIEPVPLGADILLSSSFRFNDDTMVVGGKETENYGIDARNGKVRYICSMDGCVYTSEGPDPQTALLREDEDDDVLVISRHTKTIRSIDMRTGSEKWNFSVGQHELSYISQSNIQPPSIGQEMEEEECRVDEENLWIEDEVDGAEAGDDVPKKESSLPVKIRVIVPQGVVLAVEKDDPEAIIWQHKLEAAIADAWTLDENTLKPISLFSAEHNFALSSSDDEDEEKEDVPSSPLLYVGMHNEQLYVQPSIQMRNNVERATSQILTSGSTDVRMPRVRWLPYLATASSRTPAVIAQKNPLLITHEQDDVEKLNGEERNLALRQKQYPYDNGYYLFPDKSRMLLPNVSTPESEDPYEDITVSLMNWWREVLAISVVSSILVHLLLVMLCKSFNKKPASVTNNSESESAIITKYIEADIKGVNEPSKQYNSRYQTDFKQVACLGKGGFGVVFQVKNNMDDCDYAVKRIALNNSDRAKQKVMREVKALAKLDHVNIVRYNQAWFECPPPGWQEEEDLNNADLQDLETSQASTSVRTSTPTASEKGKPAHVKEIGKSMTDFNPLRPFGTDFSQQLTDISESAETEKIGSSEGFEPSLTECSSSISSGVGFIRSNVPDDSFEICFEDNSSLNEPFKAYSEADMSESVDIIFDADSKTEAKSQSKPTPMPSVRPQTLRLSSRPSSGQPSIIASKIYLYIQMQMCQRESLKDWLCNNTLSRDRLQCLNFFHQILSAVDYVHQCGLMHRDLKPSNIFFSMDGAIKVGDFGLVTALEENCENLITPDERSHSRMKSRRHTDQVGTELYMSPEQYMQHPYTQKVDIYALGLIFFELFFPFGTQMERIQTLLDVKKLSFPKRFERELKKEYEFVQPMLSHSCEQRPSTIDLLQSKFLLNFEENHLQRVRSASRSRTISTSSSGSDILKSS